MGFQCFSTPADAAQFKPISDKCCCPCFLLSGSGAYLSILGVAFTDKFIVQRLTDAIWVGEATPHEDGRLHHLARVFHALRLAIETLDKYYDQVSNDQSIPELILNEPHPRFFPYPTKFREYSPELKGKDRKWTNFKYVDLPRTGPTNITFIAEAENQSRMLVVKFVERYGVEAHVLLASEEMAPRLLYCGLLDGETDVRDGDDRAQGSIKTGGLYVGPIRMVVMDYIKGSTLNDKTHRPDDVLPEIKKAVKMLHDRQLVFGDLRPPNVMVASDNKVYLIDFDWSGKVNEARYPLHLSTTVKWPKESKKLELEPILIDHDLLMLERLFD